MSRLLLVHMGLVVSGTVLTGCLFMVWSYGSSYFWYGTTVVVYGRRLWPLLFMVGAYGSSCLW